jgi:hypothetical protein
MTYVKEKEAVEMKTNVIPSTADKEKAYERILSLWPIAPKPCTSLDLPSNPQSGHSILLGSAQSILGKVKEEIYAGDLEKAKIAFDKFIESVNNEPEIARTYGYYRKEFEIAQQNFADFAAHMRKKDDTAKKVSEATAAKTKLTELAKKSRLGRFLRK